MRREDRCAKRIFSSAIAGAPRWWRHCCTHHSLLFRAHTMRMHAPYTACRRAWCGAGRLQLALFQSVSFHVAFLALLWDPCLVSVWARTAIPCPLAHAGHAYKPFVRSMMGLALHKKATAGAAAQSVPFHVECTSTLGRPAGESLGMQCSPTLSGTRRAYVCIIYAAQGGLVRPRAGCSCLALAAYLSPPTGTP